MCDIVQWTHFAKMFILSLTQFLWSCSVVCFCWGTFTFTDQLLKLWDGVTEAPVRLSFDLETWMQLGHRRCLFSSWTFMAVSLEPVLIRSLQWSGHTFSDWLDFWVGTRVMKSGPLRGDRSKRESWKVFITLEILNSANLSSNTSTTHNSDFLYSHHNLLTF